MTLRSVDVELLVGAECHLCDDARTVLDRVLAEWRVENPELRITAHERDISSDPALIRRYAEDIPVVLIDGRVHSCWTVDPRHLREALRAAFH